MKGFIELGYCDKPHGIKGGFSFKLFNLEDSSLEEGTTITLKPKNSNSSISKDGEEFEIDRISFGNKVIVYLKGITDRNNVEAMLPFEIFIPEQALTPLEDGEFYLRDLPSFSVEIENSDSNGRIKDFYDNGMQLVIVLEVDGKLFDIPFVEAFVLEKNVEEKRFKIRLPEEIN